MKTKSEIRNREARKKSKAHSQRESEAEISWLQSSDFFRTSHFKLRASAESPSLKPFNSEF